MDMTPPFMELWSNYLEQASTASQSMLENMGLSTDPKAQRRKWSEMMSESLDQFMRSPVFLEAMKHNLDAFVRAKAQTNDLAKEMARNSEMPVASDIAGLFERLRGLEDEILGRLSDLDARLAAIETAIADGKSTQRKSTTRKKTEKPE
jgi:hypothetical protein